MKPAHLRAQAALVRMLYDPAFARAVEAAPRQVLASLPPALADELGAIDPRALRRDPARRERTLGHLREELSAACELALAEGADLLAFYASARFHQAIEEGQPLVLALGAWLEARLGEAALRSPALAACLAIELASARARRDGESSPRDGTRLVRAPGVEPIEAAAGALALWQAVRDGQAPPALGACRETLCAIALHDEVSIVRIERPLHAVLVSAATPRTRAAILDEAALRLDDRGAAEDALDALLADELVLTS